MKSKILSAALPFFMMGLHVAQAAIHQPRERVEVAFVLDTTGSMGDLIDGAKRKIWSIASAIVDQNPSAEIAMALVAYRDRGDEYVVKSTPLSEDVQGLYGKLIKLQAEGGGDTPESVNEALDKAVGGLQWTSGSNVKHIVFLVGDAPPHMDYNQERQYPAILRVAAEKRILVNTVQAGDMPETTSIWKDIAQNGHGRYIAIPQNGGEVVVVITPFDDDIMHLQRELDGSIVPYGDDGRQSETLNRMAEKAAAPAPVQIDNSKFYSKRAVAKEVITGGGDLVADVVNKNVELDKVADSELPLELKGKTVAARHQWIDAKINVRKKLEDKMAALIAKRDAFVSQQSKGEVANLDSFDKAVEDTLKSELN